MIIKKSKKIILLMLISAVLLSTCALSGAFAADTSVDVAMNVTGYQDYAIAVEGRVNALRTSASVAALKWDNLLEKAAMQRATEIAFSLSNSRPNGTSNITVLTDYEIKSSTYGEVISVGDKSPYAAVTGWQDVAADKKIMLYSGYTNMGAACVKVGGKYCWAVVFSKNTNGKNTYNDYETAFTMAVKFPSSSVTASNFALTLPSSIEYKMSAHVSAKFTYNKISVIVPNSAFSFASADKKVATVTSAGIVSNVAKGTAKITAKLKTKTSVALTATSAMKAPVVPVLKTLTVTDKSATSVTLKWTSEKSITGYRLYKYNASTKKYTLLKVLTSTTYTVPSLLPATDYIFAVKAYCTYGDETIGSNLVTVSTNTVLEKTTGLKATAYSSNSHSFSWPDVKGAQGYELYFYVVAEKKYIKLGNLTKNSCTLSQLSCAQALGYKIRAYATLSDKKTVVYGDYSDTFIIGTAPEAPTNLKASSITKSGLTLTWSKSTGASGYVIYQKSSYSNNKYQKIATTKDLQYSVTGLKAATKYTYLIKAYYTYNSKNYYSANSKSVSPITILSATKVSSAFDIEGDGVIRIKWNAVSGADGYLIYISSKANSGYKLVKKITGSDTVSTSIGDLKPGYQYYVRVRAYKSVSGTNVYGSNNASFKATA